MGSRVFQLQRHDRSRLVPRYAGGKADLESERHSTAPRTHSMLTPRGSRHDPKRNKLPGLKSRRSTAPPHAYPLPLRLYAQTREGLTGGWSISKVMASTSCSVEKHSNPVGWILSSRSLPKSSAGWPRTAVAARHACTHSTARIVLSLGFAN